MASCTDQETPANLSVTLTAPTAVSPRSGSNVGAQPTLTVTNARASDGSSLTYSFQVATDSDFIRIVAQASGIPQGAGERTSWQVSTSLEDSQYFWRARASAGSTNGPFSSPASFTVIRSGFAGGGAGVQVFDPLTNGTSVGEVTGGTFTAEGWRVDRSRDFIRYEADPPITSGFAEWDNTGLLRRNPTSDGYMLFAMWDPQAGAYRQNPYRVHLQKRDERHLPPYLRLRWISGGAEIELAHNMLEWDPATLYHWRVEWGPEGGTNVVRVLLNGSEVMSGRYDRPYSPRTQWVELGINLERQESVVGAVYSNFQMGAR
jgi:hypothetical protein